LIGGYVYSNRRHHFFAEVFAGATFSLGPHELEWYSANEMALTMTLAAKPKVAPAKTSAKK
jgi:hypothetical protein